MREQQREPSRAKKTLVTIRDGTLLVSICRLMDSVPEAVVLRLQFLFLKQLPNDGIEFLEAVTQLSHDVVDAAVRLVQSTNEEIAYLSHKVREAEEAIRLSVLC